MLGLAAADIPAHCMQTDVEGDWVYELAKPSDDHDSLRSACEFDGNVAETLQVRSTLITVAHPHCK